MLFYARCTCVYLYNSCLEQLQKPSSCLQIIDTIGELQGESPAGASQVDEHFVATYVY